MITPPPGLRVYLACGYTDMRKGMATLAMLVQQALGHDPFSGAVYAFRGRVWLSDMVVGGLFVIGGLVAWSQRTTRKGRAKGSG